MDENNININDMNLKLEELMTKYKLLEKVNEDNNERIKTLNTQLNFLRKEYKKELENLKKEFDNQIIKFKTILKEQNKKEKEAILIIDKNKVSLNIKKEKEKSKYKTELLRRKSKEKKEDKNKYQNEYQKDEIKKDEINKNQEEKKKNNGYKETTILELFENKLTDIFFDPNQYISSKDINDLKKIAAAIIIKGHGPSQIVSEFVTNNLNNYNNGPNQSQNNVIEIKKREIFRSLPNNSLFKKIEKKSEEHFITEFRKKFGITEVDISDFDLKSEILNNDYDGKNVLKAILKKLNYLAPTS